MRALPTSQTLQRVVWKMRDSVECEGVECEEVMREGRSVHEGV